MEFRHYPILILSNEPWGDIWFSKQHYANELSKLGYKVIFLDPPSSWKIGNIFSHKIAETQVNENLSVISYKNNFPVRYFSKVFTYINDFLNSRKVTRRFNVAHFLVWQFDPLRFAFLDKKKFYRIYHVADPYMDFPLDKIIAKNADIIACTSPKYIDFYLNTGKKVLFIPHCVAEDEYATDNQLVESYKEKWGDYLLFVGSISHRTDLKLLQKISLIGPKIILIGNSRFESTDEDHFWHKLVSSPNVEWLGPIHAQNLKNYIAGASICLNTYKFNDINSAGGSGSPMKMLNYLAQYKPIITSIDSEIPSIDGKGIFRAFNQEEFVDLIYKGIEGKLPVDKNVVQEYLESHTYPSKIKEILNSLKESSQKLENER